MRINKYLSECGYCSRREADRLIEAGRVRINSGLCEPGAQVSEGDSVSVDGKTIRPLQQHTYLIFNKPKGIVCTFEPREKDNLKEYLNFPTHITYAGRLDRDSEGLLLLTDDGDLINELMTGHNGHEKEYIVRVSRGLTSEKIECMKKGIHLKEIDMDTRPCKAWITAENEFHIVLTQGINRQIRRMCKNLGMTVVYLQRIRIENLTLGDLKAGKYRSLTKAELSTLKERIR